MRIRPVRPFRQPMAWPLSQRLAIAAVAGGLVLAIAGLMAARAEQRADIRAEALLLLDRSTRDVVRALSDGERLLQRLARDADVINGTPDACRIALAREADAQSQYNNLTRTPPSGVIDCAGHPLPRRLSVGHLPSFQRALRTRAFSIGDFQRSQVTGRTVMVLAQPVLAPDGRVRHVLAASLLLSHLDSILAAAPMPSGASVFAFDSTSRVVISSSAVDFSVTRDILDRAMRLTPRDPVLVIEPAADTGVIWTIQRLRPSSASPVFLAVRAPVSIALAQALQRMRFRLGALLLVITLVVIATYRGARVLVLDPLANLREGISRIEAGDLDARVPTALGTPEFDHLGRAFNAMAEAVHARTAELSALVDHSPDGIARIATDGTLLYANPALARQLQVVHGSLAVVSMERAFPEPLARATRSAMQAAGTVGSGSAASVAAASAQRAVDVTLRDGDPPTIVDIRVVATRDEDGLVSAYLLTARDVSVERQTAEALRQSQKLDSIGQLAGGIAHDFNNLLTGIVGHAELALDGLEPGHQAYEDVQSLRDAALRSAGMTRQLLTFARRDPARLEPTDLNEVVRRVAGLLRRLIGPGVDLMLDVREGIPAAHADAGQIEQVLINLAVNARDAMPNGGTVVIRTRPASVDASKAAALGLAMPGHYLAIEVEDTGTGMSSEVLSRIFEPLFTTKPAGRGTGLGLSTCYGIARAHGGALSVTSVLGVGTRFTLFVQTAAAHDVIGGSADEALPDLRAHTGTRVLLVEDDDALRTMLARVLRGNGYDVLEAVDCASGLALATTGGVPSFDIVISDVRTPRLTARAFSEQLARAHPELPLLFITGHPDDIEPNGTLDGRPVLAKPFTSVQLLHAAARLLEPSLVASV
ncbi:MAG: ATP-binding protein [Gemmatimonadaceae bacterium]|nr:ATP-binding protein [Gemmatimonadaceae bacterium]